MCSRRVKFTLSRKLFLAICRERKQLRLLKGWISIYGDIQKRFSFTVLVTIFEKLQRSSRAPCEESSSESAWHSLVFFLCFCSVLLFWDMKKFFALECFLFGPDFTPEILIEPRMVIFLFNINPNNRCVYQQNSTPILYKWAFKWLNIKVFILDTKKRQV